MRTERRNRRGGIVRDVCVVRNSHITGTGIIVTGVNGFPHAVFIVVYNISFSMYFFVKINIFFIISDLLIVNNIITVRLQC